MQQTVFTSKENVDVIVINTSDLPVKLHRNTHLGSIKTVAKTDLIVEPMSNFVPVENCPDEEELNLTRINNAKIEHMHKGLEYVPVPTTLCNHAFTLHMHEHPNTNEEEEERKIDYKNLGYFQKTVSKTLDESNNGILG